MAQMILRNHGKSPMALAKAPRPSTKRIALKRLEAAAVENCRVPAQPSRRSPRKAPRKGASKHVHVCTGPQRRALDNLENTDPSSAYGSTIFSVYPCKKCHALIETQMNHSGKITGLLHCTVCSFQFCFHCELARSDVYGKGQRRCPEHIHTPPPGQELSLQAQAHDSTHTPSQASKGRNLTKEALKQRRSCRRLLSPKKRALKKRTLR